MHSNLLLNDARGRNALATGDFGGPARMNALAEGCIAGWMHHHKALAGLIAPTVNCSARLRPASLSGFCCNWGGDHRGVNARVDIVTWHHVC